MTQMSKTKRDIIYEEAQEVGLLVINKWTGHAADLRLRSRLEKFAIAILNRKDELNEE